MQAYLNMHDKKRDSVVRTEPAGTAGPTIEIPTPSTANENPWIRFWTFVGWFPRDMPSAEKLLVLKIDLSILIFGCLSFFTKYLDQQSLTNAYVR